MFKHATFSPTHKKQLPLHREVAAPEPRLLILVCIAAWNCKYSD